MELFRGRARFRMLQENQTVESRHVFIEQIPQMTDVFFPKALMFKSVEVVTVVCYCSESTEEFRTVVKSIFFH